MMKMVMPVIRLTTKTMLPTMIAISTVNSNQKNCSESS
jgi:hypothetical protein